MIIIILIATIVPACINILIIKHLKYKVEQYTLLPFLLPIINIAGLIAVILIFIYDILIYKLTVWINKEK